MSFASNRKKRENLDDLAGKLESTGKQKYDKDTRFWYPKLDEGNGYAIIRFLPAKDGEDAKWVQRYTHGYKVSADDNSWYIENCPTTVDVNGEQIGKCPQCEANSQLYKDLGETEAKKIVSAAYPYARKRKMKFTSNVYVISDPATPENQGKVFLYEYGSKIFDKLKLALKPAFPNDPKFNPFNMDTGASFELKIRKVDSQVNYDSSMFQAVGALHSDDDVMEGIYNKIYSLEELISPEHYKDHATLKTRMDLVLGNTSEPTSEEVFNTPEPSVTVEAVVGETVTTESLPEANESGDDNLDYFNTLVDKDNQEAGLVDNG